MVKISFKKSLDLGRAIRMSTTVECFCCVGHPTFHKFHKKSSTNFSSYRHNSHNRTALTRNGKVLFRYFAASASWVGSPSKPNQLLLVWNIGFGLMAVWVCAISWLARDGNVMAVSIRSPSTNSLIVSAVWQFFGAYWSVGAQIPSTNGRYGNLYFRRIYYFRFVSEFHFRAGSYFRNRVGTPATPYLWPKDHGSGHFRASYVTGTRHYEHRRKLSGRQRRSWLASQVTTTFNTCWNGFGGFLGHFYVYKSA